MIWITISDLDHNKARIWPTIDRDFLSERVAFIRVIIVLPEGKEEIGMILPVGVIYWVPNWFGSKQHKMIIGGVDRVIFFYCSQFVSLVKIYSMGFCAIGMHVRMVKTLLI